MTGNPSKAATLAKSPAWRRIMGFYQTLKPGLHLMRLPVLGPRLQKILIPEGTDANWFIPIGEAVSLGNSYILPRELVASLLLAADGIFVMSACPCRIAFHCKNHPHTLGCMHLGLAARGIPPDLGRLVTHQEALDHLNQALDAGLLPTILHIPSEANIFKVEKTRLLSVCFCFECCCDVRLLLREGPDRYWDQYNHRLPGLQVLVSQACILCGECLSACYGGERVIHLGDRQAQIGDRCIGCGRCIPACPQQAISLQFDPHIDLVQALFERISQRVQIGPD